ncbi:F5/8 type C domain-containing protein [Roseimicrobium gellanilyticum]|uniref:histidine kinase n=1 Tax=Roseimicrobium gellanilyticum TaxID=748857 RepID=A0A366HIR2_9BACT|nr:discoidin domain-containing protein [Roseimicrobium gellanilyticum]RBP42552.1 F5/8 type C domain-containing protein [Roseimicrobium gellanilyticum]
MASLRTTFPWLILFLLMSPSSAVAEVWTLLNKHLASIDHWRSLTHARLASLPPLPPPQAHEHAGFHSSFSSTEDAVRWVQVDLGKEVPVDQVVVIPAYFGATSEGAGPYGWPARFRIDASRDAEFTESVTLFDGTGQEQPSRVAPCVADGKGITARYVRFSANRLARQLRSQNRYMFCLGELMVFSQGVNVALHAAVTSTRSLDTPPTWSATHLVDGWTALGIPAILNPSRPPGNGWHSGISPLADTAKWVQVDLGSSTPIEEVRLYPAHPPDFPDRPGFGFPRRFRLESSNDATFTNAQVIADHTDADFANPADNVVTFRTSQLKGRYVRLTATQLWQRNEDFVFALAELEVMSSGRNVAMGAPVTFLDETSTGSWNRTRLVDGEVAQGGLVDPLSWYRELAGRVKLEEELIKLDSGRTAALALAHERALWVGGTLVMSAAVTGLALMQRGRQARRRELEALRERIARDLHDEVGSHLGSISLAGELALRQKDLDEDTRAALDEMQRAAKQAAESMRGILWLVREEGEPSLLRLMQALRESATAQLHGIDWDVQVKEPALDRAAPLEFHRHVFLFFKEAMHNIARHAHATEVRVNVAWHDHAFDLSIHDNGHGFDAARKSDGSGLANMKHRAEALHGRMELATVPGSGTTITLNAQLA